MSDNLDLLNCIEIQKIREILIHHPDLLSMFELLIIVCNKRINDEKAVINIPIEKNIEPELSSDSEDDVME
jgi:hypothetical protein